MTARLLILILCLASQQLFSQQERGYVRKGNQKYIEGKLDEAEAEYNSALDLKNNLTEGVFNLGDVAYQKKEYEKAAKQFETAAMLSKDNQLKAKAYHNLGNTHLDAKQYDKSIEAYKNALRLNPNDVDTKYNLAYAQQMLKKNPQQNQQNKDNQDQDKKDQQNDKQDQQSQDQKDQQKSEQDKKEEQQNQQQQSKEQQAKEDQEKQQQAQPKEGQISKEDAKRLLEALMQQEQKVQQQIVNKKFPPSEKKKVEKDW